MTQGSGRLQLIGVEKHFGALRALDGADLEAHPGEIHVLLGENGAGKSTLVSVLAGLLTPRSGTIRIDGRDLTLNSPTAALAASIGVVHQHFKLVPALTALENVALGIGAELSWGPVPTRSIRKRATRIADGAGLGIDLDATVGTLSVGARQRIEILKLLYREPRFLVLDEPTSILSPPEVIGLFETLRTLAAEGRTVLMVAHKLDEVLNVADRVTVLREGRTVFTGTRAEISAETLSTAMVGRAVSAIPVPPPRAPGEVVARLSGVGVREDGREALREIDLEVRRGEIVAVAGVAGNGQRELALTLAGLRLPDQGQAEVPPRAGFVPQERIGEGLVGDFSLTENVALGLGGRPPFSSGPFLNWPEIERETRELIRAFDVRTPGPRTPVAYLSGGNQQKVVVGREVARGHSLLIVENPTRGLDVSATSFVHQRLIDLRAEGVAIVLISTDLDEVVGLADRTFVLVRGKLTGVDPAARSREQVGRLMLAGSE